MRVVFFRGMFFGRISKTSVEFLEIVGFLNGISNKNRLCLKLMILFTKRNDCLYINPSL